MTTVSGRIWILLAATTMAVACGGEVAVPTDPAPVVPPPKKPPGPPATLVSLALVPAHDTVSVGDAVVLRAEATFSDGVSFAVQGNWPDPDSPAPVFASSDSTVLLVDRTTGFAAALGSGAVDVQVDLADTVLSATLTVTGPNAAELSDVLQVDTTYVVEYPIDNRYYLFYGGWAYAPQVRAHVREGHWAEVTNVRIGLPGRTAPVQMSCRAWLQGTSPRDLNSYVYDDWSFVILNGQDPITEPRAVILLRYSDDLGRTGVRVLNAPVVQFSDVSPPSEGRGVCP